MSTARGQQRLYSGAFIPYGSRVNQNAANAAPLPEDAGAIDPPNLTGGYAGPSYTDRTLPVAPLPYSSPGPQVQINPNAGGITAIGNPNLYSGYPSNPVTGNYGFGATGGTYDAGGYNDPSGTYWPNTTTTTDPSIWSKLLAGGGKALLGVGGSIAGGLLGPAGSLAGGIAGKVLGNKLIHTPQGTSTFNPGGPQPQNNFNPVPGGVTDASGGYQEPGENGRYWPATRESTEAPPLPNPGSQYVHNINTPGGWNQSYQTALSMINAPGQSNRYEPDEPGYTGDYYETHPDAVQLGRPSSGLQNTNQFRNVADVVAQSGVTSPQGLYGHAGGNVGALGGNAGGPADPMVSDATKRFLANLAARRAGGIG
jgi:hypothetical protein